MPIAHQHGHRVASYQQGPSTSACPRGLQGTKVDLQWRLHGRAHDNHDTPPEEIEELFLTDIFWTDTISKNIRLVHFGKHALQYPLRNCFVSTGLSRILSVPTSVALKSVKQERSDWPKDASENLHPRDKAVEFVHNLLPMSQIVVFQGNQCFAAVLSVSMLEEFLLLLHRYFHVTHRCRSVRSGFSLASVSFNLQCPARGGGHPKRTRGGKPAAMLGAGDCYDREKEHFPRSVTSAVDGVSDEDLLVIRPNSPLHSATTGLANEHWQISALAAADGHDCNRHHSRRATLDIESVASDSDAEACYLENLRLVEQTRQEVAAGTGFAACAAASSESISSDDENHLNNMALLNSARQEGHAVNEDVQRMVFRALGVHPLNQERTDSKEKKTGTKTTGGGVAAATQVPAAKKKSRKIPKVSCEWNPALIFWKQINILTPGATKNLFLVTFWHEEILSSMHSFLVADLNDPSSLFYRFTGVDGKNTFKTAHLNAEPWTFNGKFCVDKKARYIRKDLEICD